jgi:hypothetical protein
MADPDYDDDELFADLYADDALPAEAHAPAAPIEHTSTEITTPTLDNNVTVRNEDLSGGIDASANGLDTWGEANENGHHISSHQMERDDSRADYEDSPIGIKEDG